MALVWVAAERLARTRKSKSSLLRLRRERPNIRDQIQNLLFRDLSMIRRHHRRVALHNLCVRINDRLADIALVELGLTAVVQQNITAVQATQLRTPLPGARRMAIRAIQF